MEENETPPEAARREAIEETGLDIEFIMQENVWIEKWNANSFERPYLCLLEEIPAFGDTPGHQHIDFIYVARPKEEPSILTSSELHNMQWFTLADIEQMEPDQEIFAETQEVIKSVLSMKAEGGS